MERIRPGRTFRTYFVASMAFALLVLVAGYRTLMAGCPEHAANPGLECLLVPTHADLGMHLAGYVFVGTVLAGIAVSLAVWRRQWSGLRSLRLQLPVSSSSSTRFDRLTAHLGLQDRVSLLDSASPLCFCLGLFRPRIFISTGLVEILSDEECEALLLHEKCHLESRDPLKMLVGRLTVLTMALFPVLRDIFKRYLREKEVAADERAVRYQGHNRGIAGALVKLLELEVPTNPSSIMAAGAGEALSYRIDRLSGQTIPRQPLPSLWHVVASAFVVTVTLGALLLPLSGYHP